jgi:hypothetical protein
MGHSGPFNPYGFTRNDPAEHCPAFRVRRGGSVRRVTGVNRQLRGCSLALCNGRRVNH